MPGPSLAAQRERSLFRLTLALALASMLGFGGRAAFLDRRMVVMEQELERQDRSLRQGEGECGADVRSAVCDGAWRGARRRDLEQWSAATNDVRAARDAWTERAAFAALACLALFYGIRLALTGRVRPLWPLQ